MQRGVILFIQIARRHQHVGFWVVGPDGIGRDTIGYHRGISQHQLAIWQHDMNIYSITMFQPLGSHALFTYKQHVVAAENVTVAVIHRADGDVVPIVTAQRH